MWRWEDLSQEDFLYVSYYNGKLPPFLLCVWEYRGCESCSSSVQFKTVNSMHFHRASLAQQLPGWFNWAQGTHEEQDKYFQQLLEGR